MLDITVKQGRQKLREEFKKNAHVRDPRIVDMLVIKVIITNYSPVLSHSSLTSTPGSFLTQKESLVHAVCACVKTPRNPGSSDATIEYLPCKLSSTLLI